MNKAADRVATEEGALGAAKDLNALCVPHVQEGAGCRSKINAVLVDRHRRVETLLHLGVLHTADGDTHRAVTENRVNH